LLVQTGHGLRDNKMKHHVGKQRNDVDREVVSNEAGEDPSQNVKAKTTANTNRQSLERSGEAVMIQAAKSISRKSNELRI